MASTRRNILSPCEQTALLHQARQGTPLLRRNAFDALQKYLLPSLERFVYRLIGPREESKDILREAMLALWISLYRLETIEALLPFLYRVARNKAYDVLRTQGRFDMVEETRTGGEESALTRIADLALNPEDTLLRLTLWQEIQDAIERLPEVQRQTLILYAEEDFTYQQIADAMATDIGTIRSRLFHARRNLMRHLRPDTREAFGLLSP